MEVKCFSSAEIESWDVIEDGLPAHTSSTTSVVTVSAEDTFGVTSLAVSDVDVTLEGVRECEDIMTEGGVRKESPESMETNEAVDASEQDDGVLVSEMEGSEGRWGVFCTFWHEPAESYSTFPSIAPGKIGGVTGFFWLMGILLGEVRGEVGPPFRNSVCVGTVAILPGAELYLNKGRRLAPVVWLPILTFFCLSRDDCLGKLLLT